MKSIIATLLMTVMFLSAPGLLRSPPQQQVADSNVTTVTKTSAFPVRIQG